MKAKAIKSISAFVLAALVLAAAPAGFGANDGEMLAVVPAGFGADGGEYLAPDDRPGLHGPGGIEPAGVSGAAGVLAPDDRPDLYRPGSVDATEGGFDDAVPPTYVQVSVDGFDWGSAGIGAGAGAGAILALIGAALFVRSSRVRTQAT